MRIKRIIMVMESQNGKYWGFRVTRCLDSRSVEGQVSGGLSNILGALTHDGKEFLYEYYWYTKTVKEKEIFALPYAGCEPEKIREWVNQQFKTRKKKQK